MSLKMMLYVDGSIFQQIIDNFYPYILNLMNTVYKWKGKRRERENEGEGKGNTKRKWKTKEKENEGKGGRETKGKGKRRGRGKENEGEWTRNDGKRERDKDYHLDLVFYLDCCHAEKAEVNTVHNPTHVPIQFIWTPWH
ncbi:unnamed protein product [Rhizophagus irregularis]|nr:unnamed protein product [Rhizophagus irregularis]